jgi:DNA-binding PadR family transcriptional regulator
MQEDSLQVETTQGRILGSLLESSKTTAELASELGYVNQAGNARYNMIYRSLKRLKKDGYIEGFKVKLGKYGNNPTLYSIACNIQNLNHILEEHPDLITKMQKNDSIVENIFHEHLDLIYYSSNKDGDEYTEATFFEKREKSFKKGLQISHEFFRLFLTTDKNKLILGIKKCNGFLEKRVCTTDRKYNQDPNNWMEIYGITLDINRIIQACVYRDIFKDEEYTEGLEYLAQMKCKLQYEEEGEEYKKYLRMETRFSDLQIEKLRKEVIKYLNQIKKEILNAENEKLKELVPHIWFLREGLIEYIIGTKNEISDAEATKLRNFDEKYNIDASLLNFLYEKITFEIDSHKKFQTQRDKVFEYNLIE